jgi:hypothetical protein
MHSGRGSGAAPEGAVPQRQPPLPQPRSPTARQPRIARRKSTAATPNQGATHGRLAQLMRGSV